MGILHRFFARNAPRVWEIETRLLRRLGLVRPPHAVQWITSSVCDLTCPHCYSNAGKKGKDELTTLEAQTLILDQLTLLDRPTFVIAGGEPLLRPDFGRIVQYAAQRQIPWALHTHGGHVPKWRDTFANHPPAMVAVSLDGPESFHDAFRGKAGSFRAALEAIRILKDLGVPEVVAGTVVTRSNADLLADLFPIVMESAADTWGLHLIAPEGRGLQHRSLLPTPDQLRRSAAFVRRKRPYFHIEMDNEWGSAGPNDPFYRDQPHMCGAGRFTCVVAANGNVMPCTTTDPAESQGNIRTTPLTQIWINGFKQFRRANSGPCSDCSECWLQSRNGFFPRAATFAQGTPDLSPQLVAAAASSAQEARP